MGLGARLGADLINTATLPVERMGFSAKKASHSHSYFRGTPDHQKILFPNGH
jgi:hypothetical protein